MSFSPVSCFFLGGSSRGFGVIAARGLFTGRNATLVALQLSLIFAGLSGFIDSSSGFCKSSDGDTMLVLEEAVSAVGVEVSVAVTPTFLSASNRGEGDVSSAI